MQITDNKSITPPIKSIDPPAGKEKKKETKDEVVIQREITINIKEEIRLTGAAAKSGIVPPLTIFNFPNLNEANPLKISEAKNAIDNILKSSEKNSKKFAPNLESFNKSLEGMNTNQLLTIGEHLGALMQDTDDNDELLGALQKSVFDKLKNPDSVLIHDYSQIPSKSVVITEKIQDKVEPKELSKEEIDWVFSMQEKIIKGYKPTKEEATKYQDIFDKYEKL